MGTMPSICCRETLEDTNIRKDGTTGVPFLARPSHTAPPPTLVYSKRIASHPS